MNKDNQQSSSLPNPKNVSNLISEKNISDVGYDYKKQNLINDEVEFLIKQQFANSLEQNRNERVKYAKFTFWLTVGWIFIVMGFIFCSGFRYKGEKILEISDNVLITLITTTTINVFGFFLLVMQFLFNREEIAALAFLFNPKGTAAKPAITKSETSKPIPTAKED